MIASGSHILENRLKRMRHPKTAYELRDSQVDTPESIVDFFWKIMRQKRAHLKTVFDPGAGDARFAGGNGYERYVGVEIDPDRARTASQKTAVHVETGCAFAHQGRDYDACIGNPPYVRHHDIESPWKEETTQWIEKELNIKLDLHGNLYLYFICLGLIKVKPEGIVGMVVPFEWVSRPSARSLRKLINDKKWNVAIYRFKGDIFPNVLTTASISIIDKGGTDGTWKFYDVSADFTITERNGVSGYEVDILPHQSRGIIWARRGLSPGTQQIFTLTEAERIQAGLTMADVVPCVTTLKNLPPTLTELTPRAFKSKLVEEGYRCWLIRSNEDHITSALKRYLAGVDPKLRQTYTCLNQEPWYAYETSAIPSLLFHSGFTSFGPKVFVNSVKAQAVGSVYGIHSSRAISIRKLRTYLAKFNFEQRVVAHAKTLKKIEVKQLNTVLSDWANICDNE